MPTTTKPENAAETFIREARMQYAEMWPTDVHLIADMLGSSDYVWEGGIVVRSYNSPKQPYALTDKGWDHAKNVTRMPTSWRVPSHNNFMKCIPDDADESWTHEIGMFCYAMERVSEEAMLAYVTAHHAVNNSSVVMTVRRDSIDRAMDGFRAIKALVPQVRDRIRFIENQRFIAKRGPVPAVVEKGAFVRYKFGTKEAVVLNIVKVPNTSGESASLAVLDREIDGSTHHFVHMLVAILSPNP